MMKKVTYFLTVIFAVALMSTSCDPIEDPTLEELNPEWSNLSSISTNGDNTAYPRLTIEIQGNDVIVTLTNSADVNDWTAQTYNEFTVTVTEEDEYNTEGRVVIGDEYSGTTYFSADYRIDRSEPPLRFTLEVEGSNPYYDDHRYVLVLN